MMNNRRNRSVLLFVFLFSLLFYSAAQAAFTLHLKDGTTKEVSYLEVKGDNVDCYLKKGGTETIPFDSIDFEASGIQKPSAAFGVKIYGTSKPAVSERPMSEPETIAPPLEGKQDELKQLWDSSDRIVVATKDYAAIEKGDKARVVSFALESYTLVTKGKDGLYRKTVIDTENFFDVFPDKKEMEIRLKKYGPYKVQKEDIPKESDYSKPFFEDKPVEPMKKPESTLTVLMGNPLYLGIILGIVIAIVVAIVFAKKSAGTRSFFLLVIAVTVLCAGGIFGFAKASEYIQTDHATSRVKTILGGMKPGLEADIKFQTAVCEWAADSLFVGDRSLLTGYWNAFDVWRNEAGIWNVEHFEITSAVVLKDVSPPTVIVSVTLDDKPFKLKVPRGQRVSWAD